MINQELLDILVCPKSKAPLTLDQSAQELVCETSGLAYPIRDGIPVMLVTEAREIGAAARAQEKL
ncbi:Trm112 family protein [Marinagarivorans cellulosilyticus]|uniref:UPF0434 protein MARGE09_P1012 n=1 Tax=Marinagarivorans cellulosilyticus TaxID=2721545 RepID=A0AAN2BJC4_9GAMM|nr:Trm112 family protein [Marinagarivorans cellulosilyticus]BCD96812.1 hypothetical protein MARGE09_P1012 [Marinagarivorans cellulosilyticus]